MRLAGVVRAQVRPPPFPFHDLMGPAGSAGEGTGKGWTIEYCEVPQWTAWSAGEGAGLRGDVRIGVAAMEPRRVGGVKPAVES